MNKAERVAATLESYLDARDHRIKVAAGFLDGGSLDEWKATALNALAAEGKARETFVIALLHLP